MKPQCQEDEATGLKPRCYDDEVPLGAGVLRSLFIVDRRCEKNCCGRRFLDKLGMTMLVMWELREELLRQEIPTSSE